MMRTKNKKGIFRMGYLANKVSKIWNNFKNAYYAVDDLEEAINKKDIDAARIAISHAKPARHVKEDRIIEKVREYAQSETADTEFLANLRAALYEEFDKKHNLTSVFYESASSRKFKTPYNNPLYVYAWAAYNGDTDKIKSLNAKGIHPDEVTNYGGLTENIITGTIQLGLFECMKVVINQGASIERTGGFDEFPPKHYFSKPLFHILNPGVTEALLEIGDVKITEAVNRACKEISHAPKL